METEEEQQRRAFREYMLGGSPPGDAAQKAAGARSFSSPVPPSGSKTAALGSISAGTSSSSSKVRREFQLQYQGFHKCVLDWRRTDEQLKQLTGSIANLRHRIWVISRTLYKQQESWSSSTAATVSPQHVGDLLQNHQWKFGGYRSMALTTTPQQLPPEILHLTLDDALLQHEKMQVLLRQWLSQLSQTQDALGRQLEGVLVVPLRHHNPHPMDAKLMRDAEECRQIFLSLARGLYQKQILAQGLLDTNTNGMLYGASLNNTCDDSPWRKAQQCTLDWSLSSPHQQ